MKYILKKIVPLALIFLLINSYVTANPKITVNKLKQAETEEEILEILRALGISEKLIDKYSDVIMTENGFNSLFNKRNLSHIDTFKVNIDNDNLEEYVSQVIFKYFDNSLCHSRFDVMGKFIYFIFIHDDSKSDYKKYMISKHDPEKSQDNISDAVIYYDEIAIGDTKPMTFSFQKTSKGHSNIIFNVISIESCGVTIFSSLTRKDTLEFVRHGELVYKVGEWKQKSYRDLKEQMDF